MGIRLIRKATNIAIVVLTLFTQGHAAHAAEIEVLTLISQKPWLDLVLPEFERTTGHKVLVKYGGSTDLIKRFEAGETFDVALASSLLIESLLEQGKVAAGTRVDIARVAVGVGVKKGAPKPDISTADAFRRALLKANSVSHASDGPSGVYLVSLLKKFGIAAEMQPKLRPVPGGALVTGPVAKGEVELAVITIPFIVLDPGVELVGPLPHELQQYVVYTAGVSASAKDSKAAATLVKHMSSPVSAPAIRRTGLDPVSQ